jgi:hypothetical protein
VKRLPSRDELADGKTWAELDELAKKAFDQGDKFWPVIVRALLRRIYSQAKELQTLRQGELFAPPPFPAEGKEVTGDAP